MQRTNKPTPLLVLLAACLLSMGGQTEARATLSGPQVLEAMLKQMGPAKTLVVRQRVENSFPVIAPKTEGGALASLEIAPAEADPADVEADASPAPPPDLTEELTYQLPGGFRAEIRSDVIQRLYLEVGGEALLTVDGRLVPAGGGWYEEFKDLFLFNRRLNLHRQLALKGVDVAIATLGLWNERPVYVLGAYFPDAAPAQIWVDKETLLPVRWLWSASSGRPKSAPGGSESIYGTSVDGMIRGESQRFEIRYDRWQLFGKRRYPLRVQFFENYELVRTLAAEAVVVNADIEDGVMDLESVRRLALPPLGDPPLAGEENDPAVEEIHEAIDIFKKRYE